MPWSHDEQLFERWRLGKTGMPLVDANMRELKQTGTSPPGPCAGSDVKQPTRLVLALSLLGNSSSPNMQGCTMLTSAVERYDASR